MNNMQRKIIQIFVLTFSVFFLFAFKIAVAEENSPIGLWKTIDDETNQPRSIVQIWESEGKLYGKIEKIFYRPGEGPDDICKKCTGSLKNQKVLGMTFMWNLKKDGDEWTDGTILDPKKGQLYRCKLSISPNGQQLDVRGYIGISLLGRTQTWIRVDSSALA